MLELSHRLIHLQVQDLTTRSLKTSHQHLMPVVRHYTNRRYRIIQSPLHLRNRGRSLSERVYPHTTITVPGIDHRLNRIRPHHFDTTPTSYRKHIRSTLHIPYLHLLILTTTHTLLFITRPTHRIHLVTMTRKGMQPLTTLSCKNTHCFISRTSQQSLTTVV